MKIDLGPEGLFDLSGFEHRDAFSGCQFVWEPVSKIKSYILHLFEKDLVVPNCENNIYLGEGTEVEPGAYIQGPAIIGKNCRIGHVAYVRENVLMGDNCVIGHGTEVKNSIFLNGAIAAHLNYIGDSILGNNVNVSGGAMLANFRLDQKPVTIRAGEKTYETKLPKFGAAIGDSSKIGANSVLNPGTILGRNSMIYPLAYVKNYHPTGSLIR